MVSAARITRALLALAACDTLTGAAPEILWRTALSAEDGDNTEGAPATDGVRLYAITRGVVAYDAGTRP